MGLVEKIEPNKIKMTFEISPERFKEGLQYAYNKSKGSLNVPGFRKGKATRKVIENLYGKTFFHNDAIDYVLPYAYEQALNENGIEPVYKPELKLTEADEATGLTFVAEVYVKPEVTIEGYYGLTYPKTETAPTDEDVQARLQAERNKNARVVSVDQPAQDGDIVTINFTGYVDDEPFEGGHGENYDLTIGSHSFIDTFETQLIDHLPGDEVDVHVTFPDDYHAKELSGKPALFKVELLDVKKKELPELDDEFAQDVSEFDTLAEYQADIRAKIQADKEQQAKLAKQSAIMEQLVQKAVMDVPEVMYTARVDEMMREFEYRLQMQGMSMALYLQYTHMTEEMVRERSAKTAKSEVDSNLVLEAVAAKENLSISDEEFEQYITDTAANNGMTEDALRKRITPEREKSIIHELLNRKAFALVESHAVEVAAEVAVEVAE